MVYVKELSTNVGLLQNQSERPHFSSHEFLMSLEHPTPDTFHFNPIIPDLFNKL